MDLSGFTKGTLKMNKDVKQENIDHIEFNDYHLQVGESDKEEEYSVSEDSSNVHWGQLKLFTSELLFLSMYSDKIDIVIYVGAGPGDHIPVIAKLFSHLTFHLYDRQKFVGELNTMDNVTIYNKYFMDEDIQIYNDLNKRYLFISDIRSLDHSCDDDSLDRCQDIIVEDMKLQASWLNKMKFKYAMLKFRLPFPIKYVLKKYGETFDYFGGTLLKQAFPKKHSTECRLIVDSSNLEIIKWNLKKHESKMFYHNKIVRQLATYKNLITNDDEHMYSGKTFKHKKITFKLNNNYDTMNFSLSVIKYMVKFNIGVNQRNFHKMCDYIIKGISN